ncbi:MAG TPA: bifunctional phosphoglucose/phosphomannose isomerase [Nitrososphaera sp.]|jgi:glucose/mannose-6-phosphate isomerase|nr:bifunctional phosphoglucose/phosphomannose isomerase [Nitrososphaera sp.]
MLQKVIDFPSQLARALEHSRASKLSLSSISGKIANIVIVGMGASGVVGDFVKVLLRNSPIPVHVQKNFTLPAFVNSETLVVSITYSGKTRETLDALNLSLDRGAKNLVVTSSFELGSFCSRKGIPYVQIPENGFPRATLGYMLVSVMDALHKLDVANSFEADVKETIAILNEIKLQCGPDMPEKNNPARLLAHALVGRFPVIYGESDFTDVVAVRWKQQMSENAKAHCYHDVFPELLHNEVESWHLSDNGQVKEYALLLLRDSIWEGQAGMEGKIDAAKRLAEGKGAKVYDLWTRGKSDLARLLSLCYVGDYVSVYVALSRGVDPGPVHNIEQLKKVALTSREA